ncbi:MAG: hypothetical protein GY762_10670, partial [Proteobacteria bacterium]|nr:hypothetical protein [Pseudomonadota bacterium]
RANLVTRLGSPNSWTSHRAYTGKERAPTWLSLKYLQDLFESSEALHKYILDIYRGKIEWPNELSLDTGWFKLKGEDSSEQDKQHDKAPVLDVDTDTIVEDICKVTGVSLKELMVVSRGPRANPARRFAVWALKQSTFLTHREIGKLLNMTPIQVANVLRRYKPNIEPFASWTDAWISAGYMTSDGA